MINVDTIKPRDNSFLIGVVAEQFSEYNTVDLLMNRANRSFPIQDRTIYFVDDEILFYDNAVRFLSQFKSHVGANEVFIFQTQQHYTKAKELGLKCVLEPWFSNIDDLIALKRLKKLPEVTDYGDCSYFCLNRRITPVRVDCLVKLDQLNLLDSGFVTANEYQLDWDFGNEYNRSQKQSINLSKLKTDPYVETDYGLDLNFAVERLKPGTEVSTNVNNMFHVAKNIPGPVALVVESFIDIKAEYYFPTEKTILPFLTKRIPLIIADRDRNKILADSGLDMFEDLVDYEFDSIHITQSFDKVHSCLTKNYELLTSKNISKRIDFQDRVNYNQHYLTTTWLEQRLDTFLTNIHNQLN